MFRLSSSWMYPGNQLHIIEPTEFKPQDGGKLLWLAAILSNIHLQYNV